MKTFIRLGSPEVQGRGLLLQADRDHDVDSCAAVLTRPLVPAAAHAEDSYASILLTRPLVPAADHSRGLLRLGVDGASCAGG